MNVDGGSAGLVRLCKHEGCPAPILSQCSCVEKVYRDAVGCADIIDDPGSRAGDGNRYSGVIGEYGATSMA